MPKDIFAEIRERMFSMQDTAYRDFQIGLIPTVSRETMLGVRTPQLRALAKELKKREDIGEFLDSLPHTYFEENQLHAFVLSGEKDFARCMEGTEKFLPYIDNWATCDQMSPKAFKKHREETLAHVDRWLTSAHTYTVRFAVGVLMENYLDGETFRAEYLQRAERVRSEEYYVNMMVAWYFATALAKQYEAALPTFEERRLEPWTHNKAIQKAVESRRLTEDKKAYLKTLRVKRV